MPNIGAFIAWGFITALFIPTGWWPNASLGQLVEPMLRYLLPLLIAMTAGRHVAGDRGGVIAAVAVMGVILGSDIPMFIGAMAIGPFAGWVIRSFDRWAEGRIPAGFEMLVNNFSVGILGIVCALIGFYAVGPVVSALTVFLSAGVSLMIEHGLLPLVAVFIEPAKVLFLNNAINHGIFSPIGIEQARQTGQSIMFLLETNPGPGLGVLLAYWAFARGAARSSAPGAIVIQFFGGIHEIYFPYVLMRPAIIVAPIVGSAAAILFYSLTGTGLTAVASPGSIIAVAAMAPKGETLLVLAGVVVAAAVSFFVAAPIVKRAHLEEVKPVQKPNGTVIGGTSRAPRALEGPIRTVVFACDAGMGSSAMGATRFRKRIEPLGSGVRVMFPMIVSLAELRDALALLEECKEELRRQEVPFDDRIPVGVMIETPAAVFMADELAAEVDFFSIGTNDLTQYVLAVDRGNRRIAAMYDTLHPAVVRAMRLTVDAAHRHGCEVGICGEFAGCVAHAELLVGLGFDELSVAPPSVPAVKERIRGLETPQAELTARRAVEAATASEVHELIGVG